MTVKKISEDLNISERHAYRALAQAREEDLLEDYKPWTLATGLKDGDPPEKIKYLVRADVAWQLGDAAYAWMVHETAPELSSELVRTFSAFYWAASQYGTSDYRVVILDLALAHQPWLDEEAARAFFADIPEEWYEVRFAFRVLEMLHDAASEASGRDVDESNTPDVSARLLRMYKSRYGWPSKSAAAESDSETTVADGGSKS